MWQVCGIREMYARYWWDHLKTRDCVVHVSSGRSRGLQILVSGHVGSKVFYSSV